MKRGTLLAGLLLAVGMTGTAQSQTTLLSDTYTASNVGSGFALGNGVNSGINPPTNRMTGTVAANLRYLQTVTTKPASQYDINSNRLRIVKDSTSAIGRFTLSANGASPFDFGPALGSAYASPTNPAVYEVKISMRNDATSTARFSFGLATAEGDVTTWDFGVQLYRTNSTIDYYTIQKRIDSASAGVTDVNLSMGTTGPNTTNSFIAFVIRVTDAGAETNAYSSRVQVSTNNGVSWMYDTSTDPDLPNGWRMDGSGRYIIFDQAGNTSGNVFYDSFSVVSISSPAPPAQRIWTGAGANDNWSTPENWGGTVPSSGEPLVFDGTTRQININDLVAFDTPTLTFNNGGFSLSGNAFSIGTTISNLAGINALNMDVSLSGSSAKTWSIANGSELVLSNTTTVEVNGDNGIVGGGTLHSRGTMNIGQSTTANPAFIVYEGKHVIDGGAFVSRGGYRIGSQPGGIGGQTILTNAANLTITATSGNLRVGDSANPVTSRLDIDNSTLTLNGSVVLAVSYAAGATGIVNQVGGVVSAGIVSFSEAGAGTGSYTIKNGTLVTKQIRKNTSGGLASMYFDNAILGTASGASSAFFSGLNVAQIDAGGLIIDAQMDVTIGQVLSGSGPLVKSNFSTVTLTGANTYSGNTIVQSGKLVLPTIQTNATAVQVADGAELGVSVRSPATTLSVSSLNFAGASFGTLSFDLGNFSTPSAPLMKVSSLSASGPVTINIANGLQLTTGQIVLVDYDGSISGGFQFTLGSLPPGVTATLVDNAANSSIDLNITGVPGFRWTGAVNGDWDNSTQNWISQQTGSPSTYSDGFPTEFLDGAATGIINITIFPTPSTLTVSNNALPYVWSNGAITVPLLKKFGTNSLTRVDGTGVDTIGGIELNAGSFVASNVFDATFSTVLTDTTAGTGTFVKQGASTLTIASTNSTYDGAFLIQEGTVKITTDRALGSVNGGTVIATGATLDLNDFVPGFEPVIVSGAGVGGQGAIIDSKSGTAVDTNLRDVTLTGDTTFGSPNGGRWDLRVRSGTGPGPGLKGNGYNLTKVGSGSVSIACQRNITPTPPYWDMNLGDVFIKQGQLTFAESLTLGNPSKVIVIEPGATLGTFDLNLTNPIVRNIFMTNATITASGSPGDTNVFAGTINIDTTAHLRPLDAALIVNGPIVGPGAVNVSATASGVLLLNGNNTYTGDTTVTNGALGGTGVIPGNLVMLGGTNAPGFNGVGTLTVNGNLTLAGTTLMEIDRGRSPNSDRLVVGGNPTFGGILKVVFGVGAALPQAGDVYQLFNKGGSGSFSSIILPDLSSLPGNLSWNTTNLTVNGSISVVGTAAPPTINSVYASGGNLIFSGTGGIEGNNYVVLSATNVALPIANWTPVATNQFGTGGSFSVTNSIDSAAPAMFFLLQVP